ncbi:RAD4 DNA repair protein RAD4 [Pyrenophora tritici-repentis]|nr:RAD4 DNA repair protein RAD4 [Pyrenophora tritici-repentis]PWO24267.1 LdhA, Lactate dehydrogenase [Pyrenophora tritici-repentis]
MNGTFRDHGRDVNVDVSKRIVWNLAVDNGVGNDPIRLRFGVEALFDFATFDALALFNFAFTCHCDRTHWNEFEWLLAFEHFAAFFVPRFLRLAEHNVFPSVNWFGLFVVTFTSDEVTDNLGARFEGFLAAEMAFENVF